MVETLEAIAKAMVAPGRGILAADEGPDIMQNRFDAIHLPNTAENRHAYRDLLFTTPHFAQHISAVILCDETFRQNSQGGKGVPFPELLRGLGVVVGITVDRGLVPLAGCPGQVATAGLDGLRERAQVCMYVCMYVSMYVCVCVCVYVCVRATRDATCPFFGKGLSWSSLACHPRPTAAAVVREKKKKTGRAHD
jgi:hypothetical protein